MVRTVEALVIELQSGLRLQLQLQLRLKLRLWLEREARATPSSTWAPVLRYEDFPVREQKLLARAFEGSRATNMSLAHFCHGRIEVGFRNEFLANEVERLVHLRG